MDFKKRITGFLLLLLVIYVVVFLLLVFSDLYKWLKREIGLLMETIRGERSVEEFVEKEDNLEIYKLGIEAPLILIEKPEAEDFKEALNKGVVLYPGSNLPGEMGRIFVLGHSAPLGWPKISYDWVFSRLSELEAGDEIYVHFQHRKYVYRVVRKIYLERGEEIPEEPISEKSFLYLITCWPPGRDIRRLAVEAILEK